MDYCPNCCSPHFIPHRTGEDDYECICCCAEFDEEGNISNEDWLRDERHFVE
jgi:hypothetical protein